jgi:rubrerythrin
MTALKYEILALIEKNNAKEAEAREEYYELMSKLPDEDKPVITEIIADELNHSIKLSALAYKHGKIKPKTD